MKEDDHPLPTSTPPLTTTNKKETLDSSILFTRPRYKFWALAAIILLAFWSMLTGTVTLRFSAGNLNHYDIAAAGGGGSPIHQDLDVLEMEEREKIVKHMWDVYSNGRRIKLPRFWQEAFEAAYEDLSSDGSEIREAAVSEIAKMSVYSIDLDPYTQLSNIRELSSKQAQQNKAGSKLNIS